jgi:hypothetical protein
MCEESKNRWWPPEVRKNMTAAREAAAAAAAMDPNATNASFAVDLVEPSFACELAPEASCSYWNPSAGRWMRDGVILERTQQYMLCGFNHLTDFGSMIGAPPQAAALPSLMETFALETWARSVLGSIIAAAMLALLLLCCTGSGHRYLGDAVPRTRERIKGEATGIPEKNGDYADALFALKGLDTAYADHERQHTATLLRTQWSLGALCIPLVGDPVTRTQRFVLVVVGIMCTMLVELMFYKNPAFPTIDVCEGPEDENGMSTNCTAITMEQQINMCKCLTFYIANAKGEANGCDHCADGPFEGATSRVGARGALQNCTDFCDIHTPNPTSAVVMTVVITKLVALLVFQLLHYLHKPFHDMLHVELKNRQSREAEYAAAEVNKPTAQHTGGGLDIEAVGRKRSITARLPMRRMRLPTELRTDGSLSDADKESLKTEMRTDKDDLDALPDLKKNQVWYTAEGGLHIPVAPEMRRVALKKLNDKRKATIIDLLLRKSARNPVEYKRIQKQKKTLRAMTLPKLKKVAAAELKKLIKPNIDDKGRYVKDLQDALDFVGDIPDFSPQLDDLAARSKRAIGAVYILLVTIGLLFALIIVDNAMKLSAAHTMNWLYGCCTSAVIHLFIVEPLRALLIGHGKRRWYRLHKDQDEVPRDELQQNPGGSLENAISEEDQHAKDKKEIEKAAESIQLSVSKTDGDADELESGGAPAPSASRWANATAAAKAGRAFKLALAARKISSSKSDGTTDAADKMMGLGPPESSGAEKLASSVAAAKASRKLAKKRREMTKASLKLATFSQTLDSKQVELIDSAVERFHELKNTHIMQRQIDDREEVDDEEEREILSLKLNVAMKRFDALVECFKSDVQMVARGESIAKGLEELTEHEELSDELLMNDLTFDAIFDAYEEAAEKARKKLRLEEGSALWTSVQDKMDEQKAAMRTKVSRLEDLLVKYDRELDELIENGATLELNEEELLETSGATTASTTAAATASTSTSPSPLATPHPPPERRPEGGTGRFTPAAVPAAAGHERAASEIKIEASPLAAPAAAMSGLTASRMHSEEEDEDLETETLVP